MFQWALHWGLPRPGDQEQEIIMGQLRMVGIDLGISVFKFAQFALGACSQIFNQLNIVEHFAGWKFCSRRWSIPMKSLVHMEELCSRSVPLEHALGAKSLVCISLNSQRLCSVFGWNPGCGDFPRLLWVWGPATFIENKRKMEPEELPKCTIPLLLIMYTWQLEVLATALGQGSSLWMELLNAWIFNRWKTCPVCKLNPLNPKINIWILIFVAPIHFLQK